MNVSLTPKLEAFVRREVAEGLYGSASEVVREALRRPIEAEAASEDSAAAEAVPLDALVARLRLLELRLRTWPSMRCTWWARTPDARRRGRGGLGEPRARRRPGLRMADRIAAILRQMLQAVDRIAFVSLGDVLRHPEPR